MDQFLTRDIWSQVNKLTNGQKSKIAAVSYISKCNIKLIKGDILICDASDRAIKHGVTSANALKEYFYKGVKIFSNDRLHCKLLLTDKYVIIGSANSSYNSANLLIEAGLISASNTLKSQTRTFCHALLYKQKCINKTDLNRILKIKVVRKPLIFSGFKFRPKQPQGNRYWIAGLEEYVLNKVDQKFVDEECNYIHDKEKINVENINWIRVTRPSQFREKAIAGDQVLQVYTDKEKKTSVLPFSTVLRTYNRKNHKLLFIDESKNDGHEIKWAIFESKLKMLDLEGRAITKNSTREISENDAILLSTLFKK